MSENGHAPNKNLLVIISAPSGAGKTTLCEHLLKNNPGITRAVTCTTRAPRDGEREGIDYYFLDPDVFLKRVQAGEFLEHATVHGNSYGILKSEVYEKLTAGKDVLLNIDVQGEETIRRRAFEDDRLCDAIVTIFLTPPSASELERRLRNRSLDAEDVIQKRLGIAKHEMAHWRNFDYLLISDTMSEDLRRAEVIIEAERMKRKRSKLPEYE